MLLYRQERLQYTDQKEASPDTDICDVYGAEHLLRLFGKPVSGPAFAVVPVRTRAVSHAARQGGFTAPAPQRQ